MNKKELKKLKKLRDELNEMAESEKIKFKNLVKIGISKDRIKKANRTSVTLEVAVEFLDDLLFIWKK